MSPRKFKNPKKKSPQLCQRPLTVSYEPKASADPLVEMDITETSSVVKKCTSIAKYEIAGVHYCDRCYKEVTTTQSYSGEEYGDPDEPCDSGGD